MRITREAARLALLAHLGLPSAIAAQLGGVPEAPRAAPSSATSPAARVVSLHPAATEILLALGVEGLLVARMEGDLLERTDLARLPSVGEMLSPDLEVLVSVEPDLVIAWPGSDLSALSRVVERRGGRVELVALERLSDVAPAIERIGAWVGRAEAAERLAESMSATLAEARRGGTTAAARPRVAWIVWSDPIVAAGPSTLLDDVIQVAGGRNAAAARGTPWPRLGMESLLALDPDVLVWPEDPGLFPAAELAERSGWRTLRAVEEGRVLVVDAERFHDAGPEIAAAALELAGRLRAMTLP